MTSAGPLRTEPLVSSDEFPQQVDVITVGGGLNGVMSANWLSKAGVRVALFEKGEIAGESSGRAFGWVSDLLLDPVPFHFSRFFDGTRLRLTL